LNLIVPPQETFSSFIVLSNVLKITWYINDNLAAREWVRGLRG